MLQPLNPKNAAVLVVEDSPDDTRILMRALERFGIRRVHAATTAEEALDFLAGQRCDVVLVDYTLPGMNGLRLLEHIRERWPELRVLLVTGSHDEQVAVAALKLGAADYVAKDDLLTSAVIRSLQATLRERTADAEERRQELLVNDAGGIEGAYAEIAWIAETLGVDRAQGGTGAGGLPLGELAEVAQTFAQYLEQSFRMFPEAAEKDEDSLLRILVGRGSSPGDVLTAYRTGLRALRYDGPLPFSPTLCLIRLLVQLVDYYQRQQSMALSQQRAA